MSTDYSGILCIGDPHLCARVPGFRKDDYPRTSLGKLRWCLEFARAERLVPVLLGDLFHYPRDNANWLLVELMDLLEGEILTVVGNHDCNENALSDDDTLAVLLAAGRLRRLGNWTWTGTVGGVPAAIGGTHWGERLPQSVDRAALGSPQFVLWVAHHDVKFPGYEESGRLGCREVAGVDLLVNGHVHRALPDVVCGATTWCNPGNISRVNRGDATLRHVPGVLRIDLNAEAWTKSRIDVPHEPFDQVFHPEVTGDIVELGDSQFIEGLAALQRGRTTGGEGLREFIDRNLMQFDNERVRAEIVALAEEVLSDAAKPEVKLPIEALRAKYDTLNTQKIQTEANLKTSEDALAQLRAEAREAWGTDDLEELQKKLEQMTAENERRRAEYQQHLEKIDTDLAEVERTFTEK